MFEHLDDDYPFGPPPGDLEAVRGRGSRMRARRRAAVAGGGAFVFALALGAVAVALPADEGTVPVAAEGHGDADEQIGRTEIAQGKERAEFDRYEDDSATAVVSEFGASEDVTDSTPPPPPEQSAPEPTWPAPTPTTVWTPPAVVELPASLPAGPYVSAEGRFQATLRTIGYTRYFNAPMVDGGPATSDYWIATDDGTILDEIRWQDYAPGTTADPAAFAQDLSAYWCGALVGQVVESSPATDQGRTALDFRCDHPVSGETSYSIARIIVDGDRVYWVNTSSLTPQYEAHKAFVDSFEILG